MASTAPALALDDITCRFAAREGGESYTAVANATLRVGAGEFVSVVGPTGCGKTTTLYSCLNFINRPYRKIITVEDPVEYPLPGVNQVQVKPDADSLKNAKIDSLDPGMAAEVYEGTITDLYIPKRK